MWQEITFKMNEIKPKHVRVRQDRKWPRFVVRYTDGDLSYHTLRVSFKKANILCEEMNLKISYGAFRIDDYLPGGHPSANMDMLSFGKKYLTHREKQRDLGRILPATLEKDIHTLKLFIRFSGKKTKIMKLKVSFMDEFVLYLKNTKHQHGRTYRTASINSYLKSLSGWFTWGVQKNLLESNPLKGYPEIKDEDSDGRETDEIRVLSPEEQQLVMDYFENNETLWGKDMFELALHTGARQAELFNLRSNCLIYPKKQISNVPFLIVYGKGRKFRKIPADKEVVRIINERIAILKDPGQIKRILNTVNNPDFLPLYEKRRQERCLFWEIARSDTISKKFCRIFARLGINEASFHNLRKTFATEALDRGHSLEWVKEVLGHSSIRITEKVYGDITLKKLLAELG